MISVRISNEFRCLCVGLNDITNIDESVCVCTNALTEWYFQISIQSPNLRFSGYTLGTLSDLGTLGTWGTLCTLGTLHALGTLGTLSTCLYVRSGFFGILLSQALFAFALFTPRKLLLARSTAIDS